jgi:cobalamin-dependent methionine synthase I|tara:strand:+ start:2232 stop:2363 length:132 start_codon:yes stop_codon:yes gene_type:complete
MKTTLAGTARSVVIDSEEPMVMVGGKINPNGRKWLVAASKNDS